jgi:Domain of unknown function (DUF4157)
VKYQVKENSFWAKLAAKRLNSEKMAMVLGGTIHLHNTSTAELQHNRRWLRHELAHVRQSRKYGYLRFLLLYSIESIKNGYQQNKFEVEARNAETDDRLDAYEFKPK